MKYKLTQPFAGWAAPWGAPMMRYQEWFVSCERGARCIRQFKGKREFIINNTYPIKRFPTLAKAVAWAKRSLQPKSKLTRFFCS